MFKEFLVGENGVLTWSLITVLVIIAIAGLSLLVVSAIALLHYVTFLFWPQQHVLEALFRFIAVLVTIAALTPRR